MTDNMDLVIGEEMDGAVERARSRLKNETKEAAILAELEALRADHATLIDPINKLKRTRLLAQLATLREGS